MIRINLLPLKDKQQAIGRRQQAAIAVLGLAVALLIMIVPFMVQTRRLAALDREAVKAREALTEYNKQVAEVGDLDKLKAELEEKLEIIEKLNKNRTGPARVLADMSVATPEKLWLTEFSEKESAVTITGMSLDNETIAAFMRRLTDSRFFSKVDLVETTQQKDYKRFIVKARVNYAAVGKGESKAGASAKLAAGGRRG